jgi:DNA repair protein RadC
MLYVKEKNGRYREASIEAILIEAKSAAKDRLQMGKTISSTDDAKLAVFAHLYGQRKESFCTLFLNIQNQILSFDVMSTGTVNVAAVYPREIVKRAIDLNATRVILAHNHPSGGSEPSKEDIELTKHLKTILAIIDCKVLDHIIVGNEVYSMVDGGLL